jgi:hypothetical protein
MLLAEARNLANNYAAWLKERFDAEVVGDYAVISTPFLDLHNDEIGLYVRKEADELIVTDGGNTLSDLEASGLEISTEKRKTHLQEILNGLGVAIDGQILMVERVARASRRLFRFIRYGRDPRATVCPHPKNSFYLRLAGTRNCIIGFPQSAKSASGFEQTSTWKESGSVTSIRTAKASLCRVLAQYFWMSS